VAALLISTLSHCSAESVYCVTPSVTSCSSCPHNSANCTTLSEYAQEAGLYFTSNTTMVFLQGNHTLDTNITVTNISRLTMSGESSSGNRATVVCSGSVGLSFTSMLEFKIDSLAFTSCSRLLKYYMIVPGYPSLKSGHIVAVLDLQSTQHTELVNCSFHDNKNGTALVVNNTDITLTGNTEFTDNRACGNITLGGGIIAVSSNLTFIGNTTFLDNSASSEQCSIYGYVLGGGAIVTFNNTVLSFWGTNNFINNSAADNHGGAINTFGNTVLNLIGANNFINNSALFGGAIYTSDNTVLSFNGTSHFINNSADDNGGAINTYGNTVLNLIRASSPLQLTLYKYRGKMCSG